MGKLVSKQNQCFNQQIGQPKIAKSQQKPLKNDAHTKNKFIQKIRKSKNLNEVMENLFCSSMRIEEKKLSEQIPNKGLMKSNSSFHNSAERSGSHHQEQPKLDIDIQEEWVEISLPHNNKTYKIKVASLLLKWNEEVSQPLIML